jgi:hypothetical protein
MPLWGQQWSWFVAMFEFFFTKRSHERQRQQDLRDLNQALRTVGIDRRLELRSESEFADTATSLPAHFLAQSRSTTD